MSDFQFSLIFAFLAMICWGLGDFLSQRTVKRVGDFQALLWTNLIAGVSLIPFVISDLTKIFTWPNFGSLIIMTAVNLSCGIFLFKAYDEGKLAVVELVMIGELPVTIILGLTFFREKLNLLQVVVILAIIVGIFLISKSRPTWRDRLREFFGGRGFVLEKGVLLASTAFIFSAACNFLTTVNARNISAFAAVWFPWMLSSLLLFSYLAYSRGTRSLWRSCWGNKHLIFWTGIINTAAWVFYALATSKEEISVIMAIVSGYAVVAMILGVKFNKEVIGRWQYLGAVLIFAGAIAMSFISGP